MIVYVDEHPKTVAMRTMIMVKESWRACHHRATTPIPYRQWQPPRRVTAGYYDEQRD
jgi:hypothetical protein